MIFRPARLVAATVARPPRFARRLRVAHLAVVGHVGGRRIGRVAAVLRLLVGRQFGVLGARLLVVGGAGGRLDHALGNIVVLAGADLADFAVTASIGEAAVQPASPARGVTAYGSAGDTVSLLPLFGDAHGVSTVGLRYRLDAATLDAEAARGVSNTIATPPAKVVVEEGTVAVVEPRGTARLLATHHPPGGRP